MGSSNINVAALFAATLALIVAFAWTSVATKSVQQALPVRHKNDIVKITLIYALIVTLFMIFVVCMLNATNKTYYTYTGKVFLNFGKYIGKSSYLLNFWGPNDKKDNETKNNETKDNETKDNETKDNETKNEK